MSLYSEIDKTSKYKLLELDPDLLEYLTTSERPQLILKGPRNDSKLVLCTDTKTFKVREIQHSNSLFVMRSGANDCRLLSNVPSSWETIDITGSNDHCDDAFHNVPVYYGATGTNLQHDAKPTGGAFGKPKLERKRPETLVALKLRVPVSEAQFSQLWADRAGVELTDGRLYTLSDDVINDVLRDILVVVMKDIKSVDPALVYAQLAGADGGPYEEPETVVESVIKKFSVNNTVRMNWRVSALFSGSEYTLCKAMMARSWQLTPLLICGLPRCQSPLSGLVRGSILRFLMGTLSKSLPRA